MYSSAATKLAIQAREFCKHKSLDVREPEFRLEQVRTLLEEVKAMCDADGIDEADIKVVA